MALQLQVSNSLNQLADALCAGLKTNQLSVFQPHYIVTQTDGMNNWLKFQIAEKLGIAANCRFLKPNDLIHQVFFILGGQNRDPLSTENQCWLLYKLLAEREFVEKFRNVSQYYKVEGPDRDLKRMALAEKVADLFDQYQVYRSEMIRRWNQDQLNDVQADEWQKFLWIKAKHLSEDRLPDKTFIGNYILEVLKEPAQQEKLRLNMPAIHVFGLSVTTGFHIELFYEIGQYIDFFFHLLNPAPSVYWFEDRSEKQVSILKKKGFLDRSETSNGNALLTSWGKVIQNTFGLLFQYDHLINVYEEIAVEEPLEDSLLHKIQGDIFHNRTEQERRNLTRVDVEDGSIVINSCFTIAREVEVLYNYLVHLVDLGNEPLSARDIVVMVSDIDDYAPYIKAVFDNSPYQFPYHIADESYTSEDNITSALQGILTMNNQNFKAEDVLQLLDYSFIRKRFGLTNLLLIRKVVNAANIRFGIEGNQEDESIYVSWKYGIERIIHGICMSGGDECLTGEYSLYPVDIIEGSDSLEIIRFCHFIHILMDSIKAREKNRCLADWVAYVEGVLQNFIVDIAEDVEEDYAILLKELEKYRTLNEVLTEELTYDVFNYHFQQSIGGTTSTGSFVAGGITFCSLIPMRSIPFKVVGLLGLNFDKFPRKEYPVSFNLMEKEKRKGDRNVKENDKHLFLETLLSAQKYLYISYIGQSVKDNTVIPPSAMIDELIDYIQTRYDEREQVSEVLITRHPLHNFSRKYQVGEPNLRNYLDDHRKQLKEFVSVNSVQPVFDFNEIYIEQLLRFLKHPIEGYFNKVLNVYYRSEEVLLSDTELFELDTLQKWSLKQELLIREAGELNTLRNLLVKTGRLPLKNMADVAISNVEEEVSPVRKLFFQLVDRDEQQGIQVNIDFQDLKTSLRGTINNVYQNKLVIVSWSKSECKYLLDAYIKYLALRASGLAVQVYFISANKQQIYEGAPISGERAVSQLKNVLQLYKQGHESILPFYTDWPIEPKDLDTLDAVKFAALVDKKFSGQYACTDPYLAQKYKNGFFHQPDVFEQYQMCAKVLLRELATVFPDYYSNK